MAFYNSKITLFALSFAAILTTATNTAFADTYNRSVTIVNNSSATIVEFYGSNTGTKEWEEDILDGDKIASGEEMDIDFNDETGYCMFDFLIVFEDKSEQEEEKFNVCDYGQLIIED